MPQVREERDYGVRRGACGMREAVCGMRCAACGAVRGNRLAAIFSIQYTDYFIYLCIAFEHRL